MNPIRTSRTEQLLPLSLQSEPLQHEERQVLQLPVAIDIYIAPHCPTCLYAHEVAAGIRQHFPLVQLRLIDMTTTTEPIPEAVFATPTYLLNGRIWSLGNPSPAKVHETLTALHTHQKRP